MKKSHWLVLLFMLLPLTYQTLLAQGYSVGERSETFTDASRNRQIPVEIYYPATASGTNAPLASGRFPVLVFGHGFVMTWSAYSNLWEGIVPEGFVMVFAKTETGFSPDHGEFGKDLAFLADQFQAEGADSASYFFGSISDSTAVMGHSMGGGAAFLAPQYSNNITVLAPLAPAETNPSAIAAATQIGLPAFVLSGSNDCVTPPPQHQIPMYDSLASGCKSYLEIDGGGHCYFAEYNFNCNFGESTCSPSPSISRADQHAILLNFLIPWLKYQLQGDCAAGDAFQALVTQNTLHVIEQNCSIGCGTTASQNLLPTDFSVSPNPFQSSFSISGSAGASPQLFNMTGQEIPLTVSQTGADLRVQIPNSLPAGIYILNINYRGSVFSKKLIHILR